jgi:hypothetical protein
LGGLDQPKVGQHCLVEFVEHHVGRLYVAVNQALAMGIVQCVRELAQDEQRLGRRQATSLAEELFKRRPWQVGHHKVIVRASLSHVKDVDDVGMIQLGRRARLAQKTFYKTLLPYQVRSQQLDCHCALEVRVVAFEDNAHSATSDFFDDLIFAQAWK